MPTDKTTNFVASLMLTIRSILYNLSEIVDNTKSLGSNIAMNTIQSVYRRLLVVISLMVPQNGREEEGSR